MAEKIIGRISGKNIKAHNKEIKVCKNKHKYIPYKGECLKCKQDEERTKRCQR